MNRESKQVLARLKGLAECDCCGHQYPTKDVRQRGKWYLCPACQFTDSIIEQKIALRLAPLNSEKIIDGKEFKSAYTMGSRYDMNSVAVQTGDIQDCRIQADEILKLLQKHKFKAVKSRKYYYLEVLDG